MAIYIHIYIYISIRTSTILMPIPIVGLCRTEQCAANGSSHLLVMRLTVTCLAVVELSQRFCLFHWTTPELDHQRLCI